MEKEEERRSGGGVEAEWRRRGGGETMEERRRRRWKGEADLRPLVEGRGNRAGEVARHALLEPLVEHLVLRQLERLRTRAPRERSGGQGLRAYGEGGLLVAMWV